MISVQKLSAWLMVGLMVIVGLIGTWPAETSGQTGAPRVDLRITEAFLSDGFDNQRFLSAMVDYPLDSETGVYGSFRHSDMFNETDSSLGAGVYFPLSASLNGTVEGGFSPSHNIVPRTRVRGLLDYSATETWVVTGGASRNNYDEFRTTTLQAGLSNQGSQRALGYTFFLSRIDSSSFTGSHAVSYTGYFQQGGFTRFTVSGGKQPREFAGGVLETRRFLSASVDGLYPLQQSGAIQGILYGLSATTIRDEYDQVSLTVGLRFGGQ